MRKEIDTFSSKVAICENCGKEFHPRYTSRGRFCSCACDGAYRHKLGYQRLIDGDPSIMRANWSGEEYKKDIIDIEKEEYEVYRLQAN